MDESLKIPGVFFLALGLVLLSPFVGYSYSGEGVFGLLDYSVSVDEFFEERVPRTILVFFSGAGLGLAALCFQLVFRNIFNLSGLPLLGL